MEVRKILFKENVSKSAIIISLISMLDLLFTSVVLALGGGEGNSFMNFLLKVRGVGLFVLVKAAITFSAVLFLETVRMGKLVKSWVIRNYYLFCIVLYFILYGIGFITVNF